MKDFVKQVSIPTILVMLGVTWAINNARPLRDVKRIIF